VESPFGTRMPPAASEIGGATLPHDDAAQVAVTPLPPRPDAIPGHEPRMPYADEPTGRNWLMSLLDNPLEHILAAREAEHLPPNQFDESHAEEMSEPEERPEEMMPLIDHHHHHHPGCPYSGHCPAPFRRMR
jgi:hypothetical protein